LLLVARLSWSTLARVPSHRAQDQPAKSAVALIGIGDLDPFNDDVRRDPSTAFRVSDHWKDDGGMIFNSAI